MTKNTKGNWTIPNEDMIYHIIIWSNPVDYYYGIVEEFEMLNGHDIDRNNIMSLIKNELCISNIRLILDDGG